MRTYPGRVFLSVFCTFAVTAALSRPVHGQNHEPLTFAAGGHTVHGDWQADVSVFRQSWEPGARVRWQVTLHLADGHVASLASAGIKADKLCLLITAERTFDAAGWMRLASDERMSTLLTPAGLAIEGGVQGALTRRYGYAFKTVVDEYVTASVSALSADDNPGTRRMDFGGLMTLPGDLPPGLYRLRIDLGVVAGSRVYNLNGYTFAARTFSAEAGTCTYAYSPIIQASGPDANGQEIDASTITPRFPWVLLASYNSNGYRGVVADEDRHRFAMSDRNLIPDQVILPMFDDNGNRPSYSLEPQFPADTIDANQNMAWDWTRGALSVTVTDPDGIRADLGTTAFVGKSGNGPTTRSAALTAWKPQKYGRYTVTARGWITDIAGRRYEGGGTYRFWIGKRMTLATATFQGQPYPTGAAYGRDIQFNPAVPADVVVVARLFPDSDPAQVRTLTYAGRASQAGLFGAAQGMKAFPLDAPGEYYAEVLATYTDADGHLWVCTMRHAGVVYPDGSPIVAHGKKLKVKNQYVERGHTQFEGHVHENGDQHLAHVTFPYRPGDVLLIAAEGQGANKIEPVLTYRMANENPPWDPKLDGVGTTNLSVKTSNGYSPHMYPEFITDLEYYYGAAPRPGFMGRFLVGESVVRAPYWPTSPNSFGGQIGASPNGDAAGEIYRLLGGVVIRRRGAAPMYAGYMASALVLPRGSENNRVIEPGTEDLRGPMGQAARFFLVGLRPGTAFLEGSSLRAALQVDPMLPASLAVTVHYPDGRRVTASGIADRFGSFAAPSAWVLDVPGVYRYQVTGTWSGHEGRMPGLPDEGGYFFVYSSSRPAGAQGLRLDGSAHRTFSPTTGVTVTGSTSASRVYYTMLTPGAVIDQGEIPASAGRFQFHFDPQAVRGRVPVYDVTSITTGKPQLGRVVHLTLFTEERGADGTRFFDVQRLILRGATLLATRRLPSAGGAGAGTAIPPAASDAAPAVPGLIEGPNLIRATRPGDVRVWDAWIDQLVREGVLTVVSREPDSLLAGRVHERLQQMHDGLPIVGADLTRQQDNGLTVSIFGSLHAGVDLDTNPGLSEPDLRALVAARTGPGRARTEDPKLVVLPLDGGGWTLAWRLRVRSAADIREWCVDATRGIVLSDQSLLRRQGGAATAGASQPPTNRLIAARPMGGVFLAIDDTRATSVTTFDLHGEADRTAALLSGESPPALHDVASSPSPAWADSVVADAHTHAGLVADFFRQSFGRPNLIARDVPVHVVVHPGGFEGAAWTGREVVLGAASSTSSWAAAFDIVAHELTHAVIEATSRLAQRGEAAALTEAFADIMATAAEFAWSREGRITGPADYLIGEDAVPGGVRSLAAPAAQLDPHLGPALPGERRPHEASAAHAESAVVSHAYYLAVEGGANRPAGPVVEGVGSGRRQAVEQALYRAWVYLLPSQPTFSLAREATLQSARDLFGDGSDVEKALAQAWTAVGVR